MNPFQSLLLSMPAETAHNVSMTALRAARLLPGGVVPLKSRTQAFLGKVFLNPVGLAAGVA